MDSGESSRAEIVSNFCLDDKVAIVTGSGSGIGEGIALGFAGVGAHVVVAELDPGKAEATAKKISDMGRRTLPITTDVTDSDQVQAMVSRTLAEFGRIDILVNNAGGIYCRRTPVFEITDDMWDSTIDVNLKSAFLCSRHVGKVMTDQKKGSIVSIASIAGEYPYPDMVAYGAAKAGIINLTRALAVYLAPHNVRVNCIAPGPIDTRGPFGVYNAQQRAELGGVPLRRAGKPREIAFAAIYLASQAADFVTGITLEVHGGPNCGGMILKQAEEVWEIEKSRLGN